MRDQTTTGHFGRPTRAPHRQPVTVLSAAVLMAARTRCHENRADFAARAQLSFHVVEGAEDGTSPAWELPYAEFMALADAVAASCPSWRELFETAAACDLLITCLLDGDQAMATDALADDDTRDVTVALLRWAITGESQAAQDTGLAPPEVPSPEECEHPSHLLSDAQRTLLRQRAAALARSCSPDAWVGAEILAIFGVAR
jgi:hypothetical protein